MQITVHTTRLFSSSQKQHCYRGHYSAICTWQTLSPFSFFFVTLLYRLCFVRAGVLLDIVLLFQICRVPILLGNLGVSTKRLLQLLNCWRGVGRGRLYLRLVPALDFDPPSPALTWVLPGGFAELSLVCGGDRDPVVPQLDCDDITFSFQL